MDDEKRMQGCKRGARSTTNFVVSRPDKSLQRHEAMRVVCRLVMLLIKAVARAKRTRVLLHNITAACQLGLL